MHIDPFVVLGSSIIGLLVGMTGAGGGALMTPMLILIFGVKPSAAISSDLVAAFFMRPLGAAVHLRRGTVNLKLVGWLMIGSVPAAFFGTFLLHELGNSKSSQVGVQHFLGVALLCGAAAMIIRAVIDHRRGSPRSGRIEEIQIRPVLTILVGVFGGIIVGLTSVGSGSLMIVLLLTLYPLLGANQLVGTDLAQAVPLTAAAALGALAFGQVQFGVTISLIIGSVPAVLVGAYFSSRAPDAWIRPVITFAILASGLKYVGLGTTQLGWALVVILASAFIAWIAIRRPWKRSAIMNQSSIGSDSIT